MSSCTTATDCTAAPGGQCYFNGDYANPQQKCYYPCNKDGDCKILGQQCIGYDFLKETGSTQYCGVKKDSNISETVSGEKILQYQLTKDSANATFQQNHDLELKLLTDIQGLQGMEEDLFKMLNNPALTSADKDSIVEKISKLTQMRLSLYQNLQGINNFYSSSTQVANVAISDQKHAVDIMENDLNRLKLQSEEMDQTRKNKIRLIEINNYYSERFENHTNILQLVILFVVVFSLLKLIGNKQLIPESILTLLTFIVSGFCVYYLGGAMFNAWRRNAINYQQIDFPFSKAAASAKPKTSDSLQPEWNSMLGISCPANSS